MTGDVPLVPLTRNNIPGAVYEGKSMHAVIPYKTAVNHDEEEHKALKKARMLIISNNSTLIRIFLALLKEQARKQVREIKPGF